MVRRVGWGHAICFTIAVTCVWVAGIIMSGAHAAEAHRGWTITSGLVISPHRVVWEHDIAPCTFNDGSGGPLPCGENMGRRGLAYWIDRSRKVHYVWGRRPSPIVTGVAHWATRSERGLLAITKACWVEHPARDRWVHQCPADAV